MRCCWRSASASLGVRVDGGAVKALPREDVGDGCVKALPRVGGERPVLGAVVVLVLAVGPEGLA